MKGVEPLSTGLQDRRSDIQLSYIAEGEFVPGPTCPTGAQVRRLNGIKDLVDWEGFKPSQEVCRTSMLSVTSPAPGSFGFCVSSFELETLLFLNSKLETRN